MSYPKNSEIEIPILQVLSDLGGEAKPKEVYPRVAKFFPEITQEDLNRQSEDSPGHYKWWNLVRWAREDLKNKGELDSPKRGVWKINEKGRERLKQNSGNEKIVTTPKSSAKESPGNWTNEELEATIDAYIEMLKSQRSNTPYNKAEVNNALRNGLLHRRTSGSVEYRMQNISAVLYEFGEEIVKGYPAMGNVGAGVKKRIADILAEKGFLDFNTEEPTSDEVKFEKRVRQLRKRRLTAKPAGIVNPSRSSSQSQSFVRDPKVKAWVLQQAKGICELCGEPGPFIDSSGEPFLEAHHVIFLRDEGPDTVENVAALCPNCHRAMHHATNKEELREGLYGKVKRLVRT